MPVQEINSNYIFTDGEVISFSVHYQVPTEKGMVAEARIKLKAKRSLGKEGFDYCILHLNFSSVISLYIAEDFKNESRISDMTLKQLEDDIFYVSLHPYNTSNEPNANDNFVIKAAEFTFEMVNN